MRKLLVLTALLAVAATAGTITQPLRDELAMFGPGEMIPVIVKPVGTADTEYINDVAEGMTRDQRREFAVEVMQQTAATTQQPILTAMRGLPEGTVTELRTNWIVNAIGCYATPEAIRAIAEREDVRWVDLKTFDGGLIEPVDQRGATPGELSKANAWGVDQINAPDVWAMGYEGDGVIVSVVDTGVNYNHIDLHNQMWHDTPGGYHYGWDFDDGDGDPMDESGHGTHCAGSVASNGNAGTTCGVAPLTTIMALRVGTTFSDEQDVWDAFEFSLDHGADVITTSLGWPQSQSPDRQSWRESEENVLAAGVHHAIAAGNEGGNPGDWGDIRTPGDCPPPWLHPDQTTTGGLTACITVGATDDADNLASFSSLGYSTWMYDAPWNDYPDTSPDIGLIDPDISGPGVDVLSCNYSDIAGYTTMSGTSMATPHLAGCMSLMLCANPELTNAQMDSLLEVTSLDLGTAGKDNYYGAGRVDIYEAVLGALELVGVEEGTTAAVQQPALSLSRITPNPVTGSALMTLYSGAPTEATISVYDLAGRNIATVHSGELTSGSHSFSWTVPAGVGNGVYFIRARTPFGEARQQMTVLR